MRASAGIIPPENVFGVRSEKEPVFDHFQYREICEDVIGDIDRMVGASEVGEPRAYVEQKIGNRLYRDVYESYPYVVLGIYDTAEVKAAFDLLLKDVKTEIDRWISMGFVRENLILVWRYPEKIKVNEDWCRRCGGSLTIRTRFFVKPDREQFVTGAPKDPAFVMEMDDGA